jgi:Outer membrane protein beta-barrel domain
VKSILVSLGIGVSLGLTLAAPASAQDAPALSIRPFVMATDQSFAAVDTFDAVFGKTYFPFFGGGVQVVIYDSFFAEASASRFRQTGERAFLSGGKPFPLGIPLTATITPFEVTGGYRFRLRSLPRVRPYASAGFGSYEYQETSSFADAGEDIDTRHSGYLVNGGAEFRLHRWVGLAVDVQYSHIPGILGTAGVSQQAGENDLGGVAARFKLVVGR